MEFVADLAILIVVCVIAWLLLRTKLRVCPHCASLFVDRPASGVYPPPSVALGQREPSPFADMPFSPDPRLVKEVPLASIPQPSQNPAPVINESADDFPVIETHEPVEMPPLPASQITTPPPMLKSGEILIEPEAEEEVDLLSATDAPGGNEESGDLMLEQDIGLGPRGLPLASRLIDAGFGVTMSTQKWGSGVRRRQTPKEEDDR